jgi:hypothetical protein
VHHKAGQVVGFSIREGCNMFFTRRCNILLAILGSVTGNIGWAGDARADFAVPPAPEGWVLTTRSDGAKLYTLAADAGTSFTVYGAQSSDLPLEKWYLLRRGASRLPLTNITYVSETFAQSGVIVGFGRGNTGTVKRAIVPLGCKSAAGFRFGEVVGPIDEGALQPISSQAIAVFAELCFKTAYSGPTAAPKAAQNTPVAATVLPKVRQLNANSIDRVVLTWSQRYRVTGLKLEYETYLCLTDGSVRRGVPNKSPDQFDLARDRSSNAGLWGRQGSDIEVAFGGNAFTTPGRQLRREPGRTGERLAGKFEASSSENYGYSSAWRFWNLTLNKNGRFSRSQHGGMGATSAPYTDTVTDSQAQTSSISVFDDDGSATAVSDPNIGGGGTTKRRDSTADRSGTYHIDGYVMELRYDSGRTERHFFFTDADRRNIWFNDYQLGILKK